MDDFNDPWCLVLSGGGAKGVFHIGVYRALTELGITVDAFIGTSIGAIVAGFLAQGLDDELERLGESISLDSILKLPPELMKDGELKFDQHSFSAARGLLRSFVEKRGADTSPLRRLLDGNIDEDAIRISGKDLGIVTLNLTEMKPKEIFLDSMDKGRLIDYLMASAAFPGFEQVQIAGKKHIDGGFYDNIPYSMARKRGYRRIIVSDISGVGRNRMPPIDGSMTVYIRRSIAIGGTLDFNRSFLDRFTTLGYLDTLRTFGLLDGHLFFVTPNPSEEKIFTTLLHDRSGDPVFPDYMAYDRRVLLNYLECTAFILGVDRIRTYSYSDLLSAIELELARTDEEVATLLSDTVAGLSGLVASVGRVIARGNLERPPYYYWLIINKVFPDSSLQKMQEALHLLCPELRAGLQWLDLYRQS